MGEVRLVDDVGRTVVLTARPRRIVSTAPANTEALFALGAGDRVVGVTTFCVDPPEAKTREKVGDFSTIDFEKVLALKPDLVVATWLEQRRHVSRLESLGLTVLVLYPETIAGTLASLGRLGRAIGADGEAARLVESLQARLDRIDARVAALPKGNRPGVLVLLGLSPIYTAGPGSLIDEAIARAGGRNVAAGLGKPYGTIGREAVIAADPDVIVVGMGGGDGARLRDEPGFAKLRAVQAGKVHDQLDPALLFHPNQRLVDGVETLFRLLHGE